MALTREQAQARINLRYELMKLKSENGFVLSSLMRPEDLDVLLEFIESKMYGARLKAASDVFSLAHKYAQKDKTMIGSEELRSYHYLNAIRKIGEFPGR